MECKLIAYRDYKGDWQECIVPCSIISQFKGPIKTSLYLSEWSRVTAILRGDAEGTIGLTGETIVTKILR